ncbi:MAG: hypothetical protein F7C81_03800, partial [Desulfurococcales archaeon]|nr:hypothetical protein [Desulfurococcales archaeon]
MTRKTRRGISPVIATVIIVAVAIAIAIAVAGWIMGLWGGFGKTESLKVFPDSYINTSDKTLHLIVQNVGGSTAQIYKIEIADVNIPDANVTGGYPIVIDPGEKVTIQADVSGINPAAGVAYTVTIYTEAGNCLLYTSPS